MSTKKPEFRRCRCLTVAGRQCMKTALVGENFCHEHKQHRRPVCPQKDAVEMPLLEDLSAIQLVASQVAHGLFSETLDPRRAGKILYACQVAAMTMARPGPIPAEPVRDEGPVDEVFEDANGELLGPEKPWLGVNGAFEPAWSHDKWLYELECERLGKPKPESPADMPPQGWLTPDEQAQPKYTHPNPWMMKIVERRVEEDQRGNLPPLRERKCSYDNPHCGGPVRKFTYHLVCDYCVREREAHQRIARGEDPAPALDPEARFHGPTAVERDPASDWPSAKSPAPGPGKDNLDLKASAQSPRIRRRKPCCQPGKHTQTPDSTHSGKLTTVQGGTPPGNTIHHRTRLNRVLFMKSALSHPSRQRASTRRDNAQYVGGFFRRVLRQRHG